MICSPNKHFISFSNKQKIDENKRARNSEVTDPIRPEFELIRDVMPVLVTNNFDEDPIKVHVLAWRHHFPIISLWDFFRRSVTSNSIRNGPIWPKFELFEILCMSLLHLSLTKIGSKLKALVWRHHCPHYKSVSCISVAMETTVLIGSVPNAYVAFPASQWRCV